jgi:hypothetical protein
VLGMVFLVDPRVSLGATMGAAQGASRGAPRLWAAHEGNTLLVMHRESLRRCSKSEFVGETTQAGTSGLGLLQRPGRFSGVLLLNGLLAAACMKSTAQLKPQAAQEQTAPTGSETAQPCARAANDELLDTPEAAVRLYVESVATNDLVGAFRAYAGHERATKFDFTSHMRWVIQFSSNVQAPTEYPMFVEINELSAKGELAAATRAFVYELLADRDPSVSQPVGSDTEIDTFVKAVNPARLASLKLIRVDAPRMSTSPEALASFKRQSSLNRADEMAERISLYDLAGQPFWWGFRLGRYGTTWKIFEHGSAFASAAYGGPPGRMGKTTVAEYEARVGAGGPQRLQVRQQAATPTRRVAAQPCQQPSRDEPLTTPEAAVKLYVESVAANDFTRAMRASGAHESAAGFDFKSLVRDVGVLSPGRIMAPAAYPMFVELNELRAKADLAQATKFLVYGLLTDIDPAGAESMDSDAAIQTFLQAVNPARLAKLKIVRIDQPRRSEINSLKAQDLFKKLARLSGADEMTQRIALYELSGQLFYSGFQLSRYGKVWKIDTLEATFGGPLTGGSPAGGGVRKTTVAEYEARLQ